MRPLRVASTSGLAFVLAVLAGCGSSASSSGPDSRFAKGWSGTVQVALPNLAQAGSPVWSPTVTVSLSGDTATATPICEDGTGSIVFSGSGDSLSWSGSLACPGFLAECPGGGAGQLALTVTSATATLSPSDTPPSIRIDAAGPASCGGASTTFTSAFSGT